MMMFKFLIVVVMCLVVRAEDEKKKDHNQEAHKALCDFLKVAVNKWGDRGQTLSPPLKKALGKTLFGGGEGDIQVLKEKLPGDYKDVEKDSGTRSAWCGQPHHDGDTNHQNLRRWSGHSAPHDMVCLCTVGENGWPVNNSGTSTDNDKLCGADRKALGADDGKGWGYSVHEGNAHVTATWENVIVPCLNGEAGGDLKQALNEFLGKLQHKPDVPANPSRYILGENNVTKSDYTACTGSPKYGVCVAYFNATTRNPKPWWTDLQKAIPEEEKFQEEKRREKEEKIKLQQQSEKKDSQKQENLTSAPPNTNQTEPNNKDNLADKLRRFNFTSGTPISMPSSWLLSAVLLI
ncbi:Variant surface glycoprotein [Trypanosoma congolense IL3000]|uniref:Variant surface glycoprotein n=1 Tax=Trypanosoma congolense (strain IL3000) TaxID=1068625 RepID=F9W7T4_TRYCI|nr:Variant surface glycoprotein [Trypanosoma congolense IL3000]